MCRKITIHQKTEINAPSAGAKKYKSAETYADTGRHTHTNIHKHTDAYRHKQIHIDVCRQAQPNVGTNGHTQTGADE